MCLRKVNVPKTADKIFSPPSPQARKSRGRTGLLTVVRALLDPGELLSVIFSFSGELLSVIFSSSGEHLGVIFFSSRKGRTGQKFSVLLLFVYFGGCFCCWSALRGT